MTAKLDLKTGLYKHLYAPPAKRITPVDVPPLPFLMLDGTGDPNTETWAQAIQALYSTAYTLKFMSKTGGIDFVVMPLEGLWWADDLTADLFAPGGDRAQWRWTGMILQPEHITAEMVAAAIEKARRKTDASPLLDQVRFEVYHEGPAAQIMYVGPYAGEAPTIAALHAWIEDQDGFTYHGAGHHHEIYINNPERTAPEKLKTVIRQPMRAIEA